MTWTPAEINADTDLAATVFAACLDVPRWIDTMLTARPFAARAAILAAGAAAADDLTWSEVAAALDRHPRIGERKAAAATTATESAWSSGEQSGVEQAQARALSRGNAAYEARFGHIFLICAQGLSGEQILAALHTRLDHTDAEEQDVVIVELRRIAALRLAKAMTA